MADDQKKRQDDEVQSMNLELRTALNDAYAAVEGAKAVQTFSAITYEDLVDQQIERISGASTQARPNELERVDRVVNNVVAAVAKIKSLPDDAFAKKDDKKDVNTPQ